MRGFNRNNPQVQHNHYFLQLMSTSQASIPLWLQHHQMLRMRQTNMISNTRSSGESMIITTLVQTTSSSDLDFYMASTDDVHICNNAYTHADRNTSVSFYRTTILI
jgi:hypothetical protein